MRVQPPAILAMGNAPADEPLRCLPGESGGGEHDQHIFRYPLDPDQFPGLLQKLLRLAHGELLCLTVLHLPDQRIFLIASSGKDVQLKFRSVKRRGVIGPHALIFRKPEIVRQVPRHFSEQVAVSVRLVSEVMTDHEFRKGTLVAVMLAGETLVFLPQSLKQGPVLLRGLPGDEPVNVVRVAAPEHLVKNVVLNPPVLEAVLLNDIASQQRVHLLIQLVIRHVQTQMPFQLVTGDEAVPVFGKIQHDILGVFLIDSRKRGVDIFQPCAPDDSLPVQGLEFECFPQTLLGCQIFGRIF